MADMDLREEQAEPNGCSGFYPTPKNLFSEEDKKWFIERNRKLVCDIVKMRTYFFTISSGEYITNYISLLDGVNKKEIKKHSKKIENVYDEYLTDKLNDKMNFNEYIIYQ